jgi:hypothetical protein
MADSPDTSAELGPWPAGGPTRQLLAGTPKPVSWPGPALLLPAWGPPSPSWLSSSPLKGLRRMRIRYDRLGVIQGAWNTVAFGAARSRRGGAAGADGMAVAWRGPHTDSLPEGLKMATRREYLGPAGLEVVRVAPDLSRVEVTRKGTYGELYSLLAAAEVGLRAMCGQAEDPELFCRAMGAVQGLRDSLARVAGETGPDGRPPRP